MAWQVQAIRRFALDNGSRRGGNVYFRESHLGGGVGNLFASDVGMGRNTVKGRLPALDCDLEEGMLKGVDEVS